MIFITSPLSLPLFSSLLFSVLCCGRFFFVFCCCRLFFPMFRALTASAAATLLLLLLPSLLVLLLVLLLDAACWSPLLLVRPWRSSSPWILTLYIDCEGTIATINGPKHKALGARGPRTHVSNRLLFSHDEVRAVKVQGPCHRERRGGWANFPLVQKGNDFADTFAKKKGADTHKPASRVAKVVACSSLAKQAARWAAEAHVLLRFREWNDTRTAAPRSRVRPPASETQAKAGEGDCCAGCWSGFRLAFSHFSPDVSRKTVTSTLAHSKGTACNWDAFSMQVAELWATLSSFAPSVERSTGSGADALCRQRSEFPGGRASQLRKLRSGLFPNKRHPGWTVEHVRRPPWTKPPLWWRSWNLPTVARASSYRGSFDMQRMCSTDTSSVMMVAVRGLD